MKSEHDTIEEIAPVFTYVDVGRSFPKAKLVEPATSGYLLLAAEVDRRPMFLPSSRAKRALIRDVIALLPAFRDDGRVLEAVPFDGIPSPAKPGEVSGPAGRADCRGAALDSRAMHPILTTKDGALWQVLSGNHSRLDRSCS
jgi:hypothetical protein